MSVLLGGLILIQDVGWWATTYECMFDTASFHLAFHIDKTSIEDIHMNGLSLVLISDCKHYS
jgi:hypothetical protein